MIYIRNADKFDPSRALNIGMITSPNTWWGDKPHTDSDGTEYAISFKALASGGFIEQSQNVNHFVIISEGAIKLLNLGYGRESIAIYSLYDEEQYVNLAAIIPETSPSTLATVSYNYNNPSIRLDLFEIDGIDILSRTTIELDSNIKADI